MTDLDLTTVAAATGGSQPLRGYLATPRGRHGPWPGVVLIHEIFGIDDVMRRHADRIPRALRGGCCGTFGVQAGHGTSRGMVRPV